MIAAAESGLKNPMTVLGVCLIILSMVAIRLQRRKTTRMPGYSDYTRQAASRIHEQQGVKEDMENLIVQLSELARQLNAQMDTRFAKLEQTIAQADTRIAALESLLRKANGVQGLDLIVDDRPPVEAQPGTDEAKPQAARSNNKSRKSARHGKKVEEPPATRPTLKKVEQPPRPVAESAKSKDIEVVDPRYMRIYELADQGQDPVEIARQTGQTTGEIELILNLRKSQTR